MDARQCRLSYCKKACFFRYAQVDRSLQNWQGRSRPLVLFCPNREPLRVRRFCSSENMVAKSTVDAPGIPLALGSTGRCRYAQFICAMARVLSRNEKATRTLSVVVLGVIQRPWRSRRRNPSAGAKKTEPISFSPLQSQKRCRIVQRPTKRQHKRNRRSERWCAQQTGVVLLA